METPLRPTSLPHRIREGLDRVAMVLRTDLWSRATALKLNATQLSILELLEGRHGGMSVKAIAAHLGVSQPTATDSISALARKGLLEKRSDGTDRRSLSVELSPEGRTLLDADGGSGPGEEAIAMLAPREQEALLLALVSTVTNLQQLGAIPIQRMCVSCRYFAPLAHPGAVDPHHCKFVDAAFGRRDIRVDCRDHEAADPASQAATWNAYQQGSAPTPPGV